MDPKWLQPIDVALSTAQNIVEKQIINENEGKPMQSKQIHDFARHLWTSPFSRSWIYHQGKRKKLWYQLQTWEMKNKICNRWSRTYKCLNASTENSSKVPPVTETLTSCQQDSAQSHDKHCQGNLKEAIAGREAHLP